jgi:hypothetical protein
VVSSTAPRRDPRGFWAHKMVASTANAAEIRVDFLRRRIGPIGLARCREEE